MLNIQWFMHKSETLKVYLDGVLRISKGVREWLLNPAQVSDFDKQGFVELTRIHIKRVI